MHPGVGNTMIRPPIAIEERHYTRPFVLASKADGPANIGDYFEKNWRERAKYHPPKWNLEVASLGRTVEFRYEHTG
jgi:hypothetical protein